MQAGGDSFKPVLLGAICLLMMIPLQMVMGLMQEREQRRYEAVSEISGKWGSDQVIAGPFITIPYRVFREVEKGKVIESIELLHILPKRLDVSGDIRPHVRWRGMYEAILYDSTLKVSGQFTIPDLRELSLVYENLLLDDARLCLGVSDMRGISDAIVVETNGISRGLEPGLAGSSAVNSGGSLRLATVQSLQSISFALTLNLRGSHKLWFAPLGEETLIQLRSPWKDPSFDGAFLPTERSLSENGFSASWKVLHLNRGYPQVWLDRDRHHLGQSAFGVSLLIPADIFQKCYRVAKYGFLVVLFTLTAFFLCEILNRLRMHPVQYILTCLPLVLFFLLNFAIAEHFGFSVGYWTSTLLTTLVIAGYTSFILPVPGISVKIAMFLLLMFSYLYLVLGLEDHALLMGSCGLFGLLAYTMWVTRSIDWYNR